MINLIYQTVFTFDWIIGLAIGLLVAIVLTAGTSMKKGSLEGSGKVFFMFLPLGLAISVYAGLIDVWIFILSFIFAIIMIYFEIRSNNE